MSEDWQTDVAAFCTEFGVPILGRPAVPEDKLNTPGMMGTLDNRKKMLDEEAGELKAAMEERDPAHVAKEVADVIFVALGIASAYGVNVRPVWELVQASNLAKRGGRIREDGKILKPEGWVAPDIQTEIERQKGL